MFTFALVSCFEELVLETDCLCTASKVFEGRLASKEIPEAAPDFEAVYHLVVDAVDTFNESWEREARQMQVILLWVWQGRMLLKNKL